MKGYRLKHKREYHGMSHTPTWYCWCDILRRCSDPKRKKDKIMYQDKGITYDPKWEWFGNFLSDMGIKPKGAQIDRINPDKGYYKENCRWVTPNHNCANRRKYERDLPRGVYQRKGLSTFYAQIKVKQKTTFLGSFETIKEAEETYLKNYKAFYGELPPEYRKDSPDHF